MELDLTQPVGWLDSAAPSIVDSEPTLHIQRVAHTDREKLDHFHAIVAENFLYGDEERYRTSFIKMRKQAMEEPHMIYFLGYFDGSPVATVSVSLRHSYLGIAQLSDVSTLVNHRRKGFARILMQHACREAKRMGSKWVALQGEREGPTQLYYSLGFRASCEFEVWENMGS
jgi:GNAT superfamily N-acetyltransferase